MRSGPSKKRVEWDQGAECGCQGKREDKMESLMGRNTQLWVSGKWPKDSPGVLAQSVELLVEFQELAESAGEGGREWGEDWGCDAS